MKIRPLHDNIIVIPQEQDEMSQGGIYIAASDEPPMEGVVVAVGPGKYEKGVLVPLNIEVGAHIIYSKNAGQEIKVEDEELLVIESQEVIAVVEK